MAKSKTSPTLSGDITNLLADWVAEGNAQHLNQVMDLVYNELHRVAAVYLRGESRCPTLQPTALVNEVYLRLVTTEKVSFPNRGCFFAFAGHLMRRILVEKARLSLAVKRGGGMETINLAARLDTLPQVGMDPDELLALDQALNRLEKIDNRKYRVLEMWCFAGLDAVEIGRVLKKSPITIRHELRTARHWLAGALNPM